MVVQTRLLEERAQLTAPNLPAELLEKLTFPEGAETWPAPCELLTVAAQLELAPTI